MYSGFCAAWQTFSSKSDKHNTEGRLYFAYLRISGSFAMPLYLSARDTMLLQKVMATRSRGKLVRAMGMTGIFKTPIRSDAPATPAS